MPTDHSDGSMTLAPSISGDEAREALTSLRPLLMALPAAKLQNVNLDVPAAVVHALGTLHNVAPYRDRLAQLIDFDIDAVDGMRRYALGLLVAHVTTCTEDPHIEEFVEKARKSRERLLVWGDALANDGHIDAAQLAKIREGRGHHDLGTDCLALATLYLNAWDKIDGKVGITRVELEQAAVDGIALLNALGLREAARSALDAADLRKRAYTLFVTKYDEIRRGITYLRWRQGDADEIAPSLFRGRGRVAATRPKKEKETSAVEPAPGPKKRPRRR